MRNLRAALITCAAAVMLSTGVSAPAHAADLGTFGFDCTITPADLVITAAVGDTFTVDFPGCKITGYNASYFTASSDFPAFGYLWVGPKIITMATAVTYALIVVDPANTTVTYSVGFALSAPTPPAPDALPEVEVGSNPAPVIQQVLVPAGGCSAVEDAHLEWGTGIKGGWGLSWALWAGAPVCTREFVFINGWRLG